MSMLLKIQSIIFQEGRTGTANSMEATETIMLLTTQALVWLLANSRVSLRLDSDEHIRSISSNRRSNRPIVDIMMKPANMSKVQGREQTMGRAINTTREDLNLMVSSSQTSITTLAGEEAKARTNRIIQFKITMLPKLHQQTSNLVEQITNWPLCWVNSMTIAKGLPRMPTTCSCSQPCRRTTTLI